MISTMAASTIRGPDVPSAVTPDAEDLDSAEDMVLQPEVLDADGIQTVFKALSVTGEMNTQDYLNSKLVELEILDLMAIRPSFQGEIPRNEIQAQDYVNILDLMAIRRLFQDERSRNKLPPQFPVERFNMIVRIAAAEERRSGKKKSRGVAEQKCFKKNAFFMKVLSVDPARDGLNQQTQGHRLNTKEDDLLSEGTYGKDTASDVTGGHFPNLHVCLDREKNCWRVQSEIEPTPSSGNLAHDSLMNLSSFNLNPRFSVMNVLASYFKRRIEDAIEPILGPVAAACQNQRGDKRMKAQRKKFLALEEKKLALRREKIQRLKRRRAGRFQPSRRASSAKSSRHRVRRGLRKGKPQGQYV